MYLVQQGDEESKIKFAERITRYNKIIKNAVRHMMIYLSN